MLELMLINKHADECLPVINWTASVDADGLLVINLTASLDVGGHTDR